MEYLMSQDYYDILLIQRGAAEAFAIAADDVRKVRARIAELEAERERWREAARRLKLAVVRWHQEAQLNDNWCKRHAMERDDAEARARYSEIERDNYKADLKRAQTVCREVNEARENLLAGNRDLSQQLAEERARVERLRTVLEEAIKYPPCPVCRGQNSIHVHDCPALAVLREGADHD